LPPAASRGEVGLNPINITRWNEINTTGKIVLIGREVRWSNSWQQAFIDKLVAQTPAAVVYTWWYSWMSFVPPFFASSGGKPLGGASAYYWDLHVPVGFVGYDDGLWIRTTADTQPNIAANATIQSVIGNGPHYNVVGRIEGFTNPEKLVLVSGHYDTVMDNGFLDNGAGTAGIIELAQVFTEAVQLGLYKPSYTLIFVAFTGEEMDLVGSIYYVAQHKDEMANLTAVINLDCIGSDNLYLTETEPSGDFDLDQVILACASDLGIIATLEPAGGSDQESFRIPYDVNYWCYYDWGVDPGISDATPVASSILLDSYPLFYNELWTTGKPGWIHTSYDNSTSTATFNWTKPENLGNHIKVAALAVMRISPNAVVPPPPPPSTVYVPDNYTTIQEAIDNVGDNSTILVRAGIYQESIVIDKPLTLTGENSETTVIDGNGASVVVELVATCNITGFTIQNGQIGIRGIGVWGISPPVPQFTGHRIEGNRVTGNSYGGILLEVCANDTVVNNIVTDNILFGIHLWNSVNNTVNNNTVMLNGHGITLYGNTFNNTLRNNNMTQNTYNFGLVMWEDTYNYASTDPSNPSFVNDIDTSNTVNGKPVYCLVSQRDITVPSDAGYVWLNNCTNVTVQGLQLSSNLQGILVLLSNDTTIADNALVRNVHGVYVGFGSFNTTISNNTVKDDFIGVYLGDFSAFTTMRNNSINNCEMNFGVPPTLPLMLDSQDLINDVDSSNTVNGKPIIYWTNQHDETVPADAGYVMLINSTNIQLSGLSLTNNVQNIFLINSNSTIITNCTIRNAAYGVDAEPFHSFNGTFFQMIPSFNTTIEKSTISNNTVAIRLGGGDNNTVIGNNILSNALGIYFKGASDGSISQNSINGQGALLTDYVSPNFLPFNYSYWRREFTLELSQMNVAGILIGGNDNTVFDNDVTHNSGGVAIGPGSGNVFFNNNIYNNTLYQATGRTGNLWNSSYPTGGNYWNGYTGTDVYSGPNQDQPGSDGIGDTAYTVFRGPLEVVDNYPLMAPISVYPEQISDGASFTLKVMSNSTVSNMQFNEAARSISFNAEGEMGFAFCRVTIPNKIVDDLWQGNLTIYVNGIPVAFTSWNDGNNTFVYFTYLQSTRTIVIVPEFPFHVSFALLAASSFLTVAFKKRKSRRAPLKIRL
jgi:parallel beta-helix repeat protein